MRLKDHEIHAIKSALVQVDPHARVYLYGSRVDDSKRGGDIDLLVYSNTMDLQAQSRFRCLIEEKIGAQKIDIVVSSENKPDSAFIRLIKLHAREL